MLKTWVMGSGLESIAELERKERKRLKGKKPE